MNRKAVIFFLSLAMSSSLAAAPRTLRVDYYHTGTASEERFSLDRVVVEPLEWPGDPARALDTTNLGKYFFEVLDRGSNRVLYSRGFASIYGEWETTGEAKERARTFHESLRFPVPAAPVQVVVKKRDAKNLFREIWRTEVDPNDMFVDSSKPPSPGPLIAIEEHGPPAEKVDLLILGDGYTAAERGKFEKDARRLAGHPLLGLSVQGAARRLQRLGPLSSRRGVGHLASFDRDPPPLSESARPTTPSDRSATC